MGYEKVRHYRGGLADWRQSGGPMESDAKRVPPAQVAPRPSPGPTGHDQGISEILIDAIARRTVVDLLQIWAWMIVGFGVFYWILGTLGVADLLVGESPFGRGLGGLMDCLYFSFVTALSVGYGDVVPLGPSRVLAIVEAAAGLLIFGCVISRLVSRRQDQLLEETHRIAFEERLGRVRTILHLLRTEIQTIGEKCSTGLAPPEQVRARVESVATVFAGELRAIHDLLYRPQQALDEESLESILASVGSGLDEMNDLLACVPRARQDSPALDARLRSMAAVAGEICGECVPHAYAPHLKVWMDRVQEQSRRLA